MSVRIISDSSCDIWELDGVDFKTVPLTISTDEKTFIDNENLNVEELISYMKKYEGRSFTACPGMQDWLDSFQGADEIYVVCMTSALSGTYNSAVLAKQMYLEQNPDVKIEVFDTRSTASQQVLFIEHIVELLKNDYSFEEICELAPEFLKNSHIYFAFTSLHNLAQNGRINKVIASTVGALGISVLGTATEEGTLLTTGKCRGEKKTVVSLYNSLLEGGYCGGKVRICHIDNNNLAELFADYVRQHFPLADICINPARGLISYYGERGGIIVGCDTLDPVNADALSFLA